MKMGGCKQYFVIIFLTIFVVGNMSATAMAYCGAGHDSLSMANAFDSATHSQMAAMDYDGIDKATKHHKSSSKNNHSSDCFDCDGSLCHIQTLVPVHSTVGLYESTVGLSLEKELNLTTVFLTRIPQPPKQLS